jgi:single-strand DNA-binding protein
MLSINKVMLTGRLTRDPETKYLPSGSAITNLSIAVNRRYQDKSGEWKEEVSFLDIETWGKLAERCAETLTKGRPVYVEGRIKQDSWEKDGQKQSKIRISADRVSPFEVPSRGTADGGGDGGDEGGSSAPRGRSQGASQVRSSASENLEFSGSGTEDDIPF